MKIIKLFILTFFATYWIATFIYVSPNNYLRIKCASLVAKMDVVFYQSWSFFAPPPQYDLKLYYVFSDANNKSYTLDAITKILEEKKKKAPFNSSEEFLDYVISGSAMYLVDLKSEYIEYYKFTNKDSSENYCYEKSMNRLNNEYKQINSYLTLINYAKLIRLKNLPDKQIKSFKFFITGLDLPKFNDGFNKKRIEKKYFESKEIQL